jgi:RNA polymerase sigma-70 factor (ECF subfamily)
MDLHRPENHADPTDGQLVQRLRGGDGRAMTAVWQRYHARLYSFLLRLCRQPAQAEDLLQETFVRLGIYAADLAADVPLLPWLFTVARNLYRSEQRKQTGWLRRLSMIQKHLDAPPSTPYSLAVAADHERRLEAALLALPEVYREALLLVAVEQLDLENAAQVLGISNAALRKRVSRAKVMLREDLGEVGET